VQFRRRLEFKQLQCRLPDNLSRFMVRDGLSLWRAWYDLYAKGERGYCGDESWATDVSYRFSTDHVQSELPVELLGSRRFGL